MALLGEAAVAMWWNVLPEQREEFGDWHSHEHFPERMRIPGFRRGSRWTSALDATGFFVLYELARYETLTSSAYLDRLNNPTPWSSKMMPHHLNMVRSQCRVAASFGGGVATSLATIRLSPEAGMERQLKATAIEAIRNLPMLPGLTGAHLFITETPKTTAPTTEQRIRGADGAAAWIIVISGYNPEAVQTTANLSRLTLEGVSPQDEIVTGLYKLAYAITPSDLEG